MIHRLLGMTGTLAILTIIEGQFQVFQRFSSSILVLKSVKGRFAALCYCENGSSQACPLELRACL
jgi:hypothetical protein